MRAFFIFLQAVPCTDIRLLSRHKCVFRYPLNRSTNWARLNAPVNASRARRAVHTARRWACRRAQYRRQVHLRKRYLGRQGKSGPFRQS